MTVAPDGSIYVAGAAQVPEHGIVDIRALVVKLGPDGSLIWDRVWGGRNGDTAEGIAVAPDGTIFIAGTTASSGVAGDAFVVHLLPMARGTDTTPAGRLTDASGVASDPGAAVTTPDGSSTDAGALDAAIVRIAP